MNNQKRHETNKSHDFHKSRHQELSKNQNEDLVPGNVNPPTV